MSPPAMSFGDCFLYEQKGWDRGRGVVPCLLLHTLVLMDTVGIGLSLEGGLVEEDKGERVEGEEG